MCLLLVQEGYTRCAPIVTTDTIRRTPIKMAPTLLGCSRPHKVIYGRASRERKGNRSPDENNERSDGNDGSTIIIQEEKMSGLQLPTTQLKKRQYGRQSHLPTALKPTSTHRRE